MSSQPLELKYQQALEEIAALNNQHEEYVGMEVEITRA